MNNLTQQLENKKKELEELRKVSTKVLNYNEIHNEMIKLRAEITILEQAIAEMQKQRQEEIEFLDGIIICGFTTDGQMHKELSEHNSLIEKRIEQLNQPKGETQ